MNRIILLKFSEREENTDRQSNEIRKSMCGQNEEVKKRNIFRFEEYN